MKPARKGSLLLLLCAVAAFCAEVYRKPPQNVLDILNAPVTPGLSLSPAREFAMQGAPVRNPPIAELSAPMLRLAGIRINPRTNGLHNTTFNTTLSLRRIPEGTEIKVELPPNPKLSLGRWSPDGKRFAFTNTTAAGIDLWVGEASTGKTHRIAGLQVDGGMGGRGAVGWAAAGARAVAVAAAQAEAAVRRTSNGCPTERSCWCPRYEPIGAQFLRRRRFHRDRTCRRRWGTAAERAPSRTCCKRR